MNIHWKGWYRSWSSTLWLPDVNSWLTGKDPDAGKDWRQEEKGVTEDEMAEWHHWLNGHEFEQTWGDSGQGSLACFSPWGHKESWFRDWTTTKRKLFPVNISLRVLIFILATSLMLSHFAISLHLLLSFLPSCLQGLLSSSAHKQFLGSHHNLHPRSFTSCFLPSTPEVVGVDCLQHLRNRQPIYKCCWYFAGTATPSSSSTEENIMWTAIVRSQMVKYNPDLLIDKSQRVNDWQSSKADTLGLQNPRSPKEEMSFFHPGSRCWA